jgi:pimeloyl-ACP methyl ester carboxylesterase
MALRAIVRVALMDRADIVGWSDGGILGIDLAMRHKDDETRH